MLFTLFFKSKHYLHFEDIHYLNFGKNNFLVKSINSYSTPQGSNNSYSRNKKRGVMVFVCRYLFLSIRIITKPITTIAIIAAKPKPKTYASVIDAGVGVASGAGGASSTYMAVFANEP